MSGFRRSMLPREKELRAAAAEETAELEAGNAQAEGPTAAGSSAHPTEPLPAGFRATGPFNLGGEDALHNLRLAMIRDAEITNSEPLNLRLPDPSKSMPVEAERAAAVTRDALLKGVMAGEIQPYPSQVEVGREELALIRRRQDLELRACENKMIEVEKRKEEIEQLEVAQAAAAARLEEEDAHRTEIMRRARVVEERLEAFKQRHQKRVT